MHAAYWLAQTVVGGGLLLLMARVLMARTEQPARRQRLGEWAITVALLFPVLSLVPAWLIVTVPAADISRIGQPTPASEPTAAEEQAYTAESAVTAPDAEVGAASRVAPEAPVAGSRNGDSGPARLAGPTENPASREAPNPAHIAEPPAVAKEQPAPAVSPTPLRLPPLDEIVNLAFVIYAVAAALLLGHWLFGHLALWRLLRGAEPASPQLAHLLTAMTAGRLSPRLLVSGRVRVPFSCGLFRQTIVLPVALASAPEAVVRWVLIHELTHLERRDAWAGLLFGLGRLVYFPLPWFWWLRRQVRLCQEYVADAAAAAGRTADYAQFLLTWTTTQAPPAGAVGVFGHTSDLFRRITMLLQESGSVERRCPRRWSFAVAAGLLALAILVAGVHLKTEAAPAPVPVKKDEPKKDEPKKDEPKRDTPKKEDAKKEKPAAPGIEGFPFDPFNDPNFEELFKKGFDPEQFKKAMEQMEQAHKEWAKAMEQFRRIRPDASFPFERGAHARLGAVVRQPGAALIDQLDLPKGQGLIVESLEADSAAAKAGLKLHDILLEFDGKPVPSNLAQFTGQLKDVKTDTPVDVVVLRKGKKETIKGLKLPEAKSGHTAGFGLEFGFPAMPQPGAGIDFRIPAAVAFRPFGPGASGAMTNLVRDNDRFTATHQEGNLVLRVTGTIADGKATVNEVRVQDGGESNKYDSVDKVPEKYREKVKQLVEMSEKGNVRSEIKKP
jgi:beta-lactamase regulating signal transducer with metallopeptidase domain